MTPAVPEKGFEKMIERVWRAENSPGILSKFLIYHITIHHWEILYYENIPLSTPNLLPHINPTSRVQVVFNFCRQGVPTKNKIDLFWFSHAGILTRRLDNDRVSENGIAADPNTISIWIALAIIHMIFVFVVNFRHASAQNSPWRQNRAILFCPI